MRILNYPDGTPGPRKQKKWKTALRCGSCSAILEVTEDDLNLTNIFLESKLFEVFWFHCSCCHRENVILSGVTPIPEEAIKRRLSHLIHRTISGDYVYCCTL